MAASNQINQAAASCVCCMSMLYVWDLSRTSTYLVLKTLAGDALYDDQSNYFQLLELPIKTITHSQGITRTPQGARCRWWWGDPEAAWGRCGLVEPTRNKTQTPARHQKRRADRQGERVIKWIGRVTSRRRENSERRAAQRKNSTKKNREILIVKKI